MSEDHATLFVPFDAKRGEMVDARALFVDAGYAESTQMSSILQKVQSKMGTIVEGYDGDFIDDSGISDVHEVHQLDIDQFKVVLYTESDQQSAKRAEDQSGDAKILEDINPFIEKIRMETYGPIEAQLTKLKQGKAKNVQMIPLSNEIIELIAGCLDEKVRLETERLGGTPAKQKVANWRKDALQIVFNQCFTYHDYQFTTLRRLQVAMSKLQKKDLPPAKDEDDIKEPPEV